MVGADLLFRYVDFHGLYVDVAGGTGYNAQLLHIPAEKYICVDASLVGLTIAKEKGRGSVAVMDVSKLGIQSNVADTVLCSFSIEHFSEPEAALNEMLRIVKRGGRIVIWSPNWDNIFRINFPQFAHRPKSLAEGVRWKIFFKMMWNEFLPFRYRPYVNFDVAALAQPDKYVAWDSDAVHCVLCQETYKWFKENGCEIIHLSDFAEVPSSIRNDIITRAARRMLKPLLPLLRHAPLIRWFVTRFPIVVQKPLAGCREQKL
jgi:SAM-dependent methyltransferase